MKNKKSLKKRILKMLHMVYDINSEKEFNKRQKDAPSSSVDNASLIVDILDIISTKLCYEILSTSSEMLGVISYYSPSIKATIVFSYGEYFECSLDEIIDKALKYEEEANKIEYRLKLLNYLNKKELKELERRSKND